ncbi:glycoside hydrolase [Mollisia scopiformis]|uniref:Glycoside hydrolase n=1 Tax=Mollisia scopiformis TaxID=149040 RepID=A0A194XVE0_MOLSC|nr:glycoside hydrolase [Mollisia scopiformis]KUJ23677.1 glycoside hydrolase [Mollisia scopiformis]
MWKSGLSILIPVMFLMSILSLSMFELKTMTSFNVHHLTEHKPLLDPRDFGLPREGLSVNGIAFGWVPDDKIGSSMSLVNERVGAPGSTMGIYSQVTSADEFDDYQFTEPSRLRDIISSKAVLIATIMPLIPFETFTPALCAQIASSMRKLTDEGVFVWLRFAHEMNWYSRDGDGPALHGGNPNLKNTYTGTPVQFIQMWNILSEAVKDNLMVKMFWSPNSGQDKDQWFPGPAVVDIIGMDFYPKDRSRTPEKVYKPIHDNYALKYNLPFVIGETGVKGSSSSEFKMWWLSGVVDSRLKSALPNYMSCSWFEFDKTDDPEGYDYTIVLKDGALLNRTKSILIPR